MVVIYCWLIVGCTATLPPQNDLKPGTLPETYGIFERGRLPNDRWWEDFHEAELNGLVTTALESNWDLKTARARLAAVNARVLQVAAQKYPQVDGRANLDLGRSKSDGRRTRSSEDLGVRLIGGYEVDLWGRVHAEIKTAEFLVLAQDQIAQTAALTLAAEVTNRWVGIIAQKMERRLLYQQRQVSQTLLELIEFRFQKSMASALDIYQQRRTLAQVEALIPLSEMREQTLRHELSTLIGKPAARAFDIEANQFPDLMALPDTGLPADLLNKRPDIRRAGFQLRATEWQIAEARANRLPRLQLSAVAALTDINLSRLLENWLATLGALLSGPLMDGGRRSAEVDAAEASTQEQLAEYHQVVLTAIREVQDAIVRESKQREHLAALTRELEIAKKGMREAQYRYVNGLTDYLSVLTELTAMQRLERQMVAMQAQLINYRVSLYRALGGHWMTQTTTGTMISVK